MILNLLILDGYGHFVWPAFAFSLASCATLYIKVKKELQKQEKMYLSKYGEFKTKSIETTEKSKISEKVLSGSSI
tara:strand:+ start:533 stop:757 length:225 start_codon:yes stop_codon:yes gene_type:complete